MAHMDTFNYQAAESQGAGVPGSSDWFAPMSPAEQWAAENNRKWGNLGALPPWLQRLIAANLAAVNKANGTNLTSLIGTGGSWPGGVYSQGGGAPAATTATPAASSLMSAFQMPATGSFSQQPAAWPTGGVSGLGQALGGGWNTPRPGQTPGTLPASFVSAVSRKRRSVPAGQNPNLY